MYKLLYCLTISSLLALTGYAQILPDNNGANKRALPIIYIHETSSLHFISPEPIQYVDISTKDIIGDLPLKNVLRIKERDSLENEIDAVITIAGEKFIAQYHVLSAGKATIWDACSEIEISPLDCRPLDIAGIGFSQSQLKRIGLGIFGRKSKSPIVQEKAFGIIGSVGGVYTAGDYMFLDLSYHNKTNLRYDIDALRFQIDDKKVHKASNIQSVSINPVFVLFDNPSFKKHYRNIYVFRKVSFPGNKVLHIELSEKQVSGRVLSLNIPYQDILDADVVPLK